VNVIVTRISCCRSTSSAQSFNRIAALAIGRQAEAFAPDEVISRIEAVQRSTTTGSVADSPNFAKIKAWFDENTRDLAG